MLSPWIHEKKRHEYWHLVLSIPGHDDHLSGA